jgi:hypothetical protein
VKFLSSSVAEIGLVNRWLLKRTVKKNKLIKNRNLFLEIILLNNLLIDIKLIVAEKLV